MERKYQIARTASNILNFAPFTADPWERPDNDDEEDESDLSPHAGRRKGFSNQ
jgi:hypothetical protein